MSKVRFQPGRLGRGRDALLALAGGGLRISDSGRQVEDKPALRQAGLLFGWRFDFAHEGVRRIGWLMAPALIGLSVTQINILVSTILASYFPGGPTYLFYGMRLIHFPLGIFGVALATALLPSLSTQAAKGELDALRGTLGFGLRLIFFIIVPAMVGLILLRVPIVHLFFEHGRFTAADTQGTAAAVLAYAVGLWAFAGVRIVVSAFTRSRTRARRCWWRWSPSPPISRCRCC